ncbi:MAG: NADH-quinone oxidoreductase subunit J [Kiritimatiellaeota bacterium]|nr:NADH-quinone oxidoreductase subunit J [Kiritimatiellota bacterium]
MNAVFYISAAVAVLATALTVTRANAVHALLYLIVALLAIAMIFFILGAPFVAALEVIIYAGAIMVLFLFVVMMLNAGPRALAQERDWLRPAGWIGPAGLALILFVELLAVLIRAGGVSAAAAPLAPREVSLALFGPYLLGVELASMLLLAGLVGVYHLGRHTEPDEGGKE